MQATMDINPKLRDAVRMLEAQPTRDGLHWIAGSDVKTAVVADSIVKRTEAIPTSTTQEALQRLSERPFTLGLIPLETNYQLPAGSLLLMRGDDMVGKITGVVPLAR